MSGTTGDGKSQNSASETFSKNKKKNHCNWNELFILEELQPLERGGGRERERERKSVSVSMFENSIS